MCRSPAAGKVPQRSSRVSLKRCRSAKSSLENLSASGRPGYGARAAEAADLVHQAAEGVEAVGAVDLERGQHREVVDPGHRGRRPPRRAGPGRWPGPCRSCPPRGRGPTVLMLVSRHTARVNAVMGLVMLKSQASGQRSSIALPMPTRTGTLRRARLMPPGPTRVPHRLGDAVGGRHVEVDRHGAEAARRDADDDEVGAVERRVRGRWWWRSSPGRPWPRSACGPAPPFWGAAPDRCPRARGACRPAPACRRGPPSAPGPTDSSRHRRSSLG